MSRDDLAIVDLDRWPIDAPDSPAGRAMVAELRGQLAAQGWCTLPGFLRPDSTRDLAMTAEGLSDRAWPGIGEATPYYGKADPALPDDLPPGHPRIRTSPRRMAQVACDLIPESNGLRRLYASEAMPAFLAAILETPTLHPMACPYQAVNISVMEAGGCQNWHFDSTEFSTTLMLQKPERGGVFECVPQLRAPDDENYDGVARVMEGDRSAVVPIEVEPGALMVFRGQRSLHRVSEVSGPNKRLLVIFHYDTRPGVTGAPAVNRALYGPRVETMTS